MNRSRYLTDYLPQMYLWTLFLVFQILCLLFAVSNWEGVLHNLPTMDVRPTIT